MNLNLISSKYQDRCSSCGKLIRKYELIYMVKYEVYCAACKPEEQDKTKGVSSAEHPVLRQR